MITPFDIIFGLSAVAFNLLIASFFIAWQHEKIRLVRLIGIGIISLGIPFLIVLYHVLTTGQNQYVCIALAVVLAYILTELLLDFIFMYDFRSRFITHFPYILLEYGAFAGLIYTSFTISERWGWAVSITFWIAMAALVYYFICESKRKKKR